MIFTNVLITLNQYIFIRKECSKEKEKKEEKKLNICIQVDLYVTHVVICRPICYPKIQTRVACRPRQVFCGLLLLVVRVFMFSDRPN